MDKRNLAFDRINYILLVVGMAVVVLGFILMSGAGSTESAYNPDIFSARRSDRFCVYDLCCHAETEGERREGVILYGLD